MDTRTIFQLALKHLRAKKLRSIVTIGGMSVGVAVIVFLLSFGFGLQKLVTDQVVNLKSVDTIDVTSKKSKVLALDPNNMSDIKKLSGVSEAQGLFSVAGKMSFGGSTTDVVVYGSSNRYLELSDVKPEMGSTINKNYDKKNPSALVNTTALETIGLKDKQKALNTKIVLKLEASEGEKKTEVDKTFTIVGVISDTAGSFVYVNEEVLKEIGQVNYSQALVLVKQRSKIPELRKQIENKGFTTSSPLDTLNQINQIFDYLNVFLAGLGTLGLLIAAGGMFNTLTVSLLERTREIGLMKILGARQKDILKLFLAEAVIMTFSGGLLGLSIAFLLGLLINLGVNILGRASGAEAVSIFYIPLLFGLFIIVFSIILGIITAIYPAQRGAKINPLQALKHE